MNERPDIEITSRLMTVGAIAYGSMLSGMAAMQREEDYRRVAAIRANGAAVRRVMRSQHNARMAEVQRVADRKLQIALLDLERLRFA